MARQYTAATGSSRLDQGTAVDPDELDVGSSVVSWKCVNWARIGSSRCSVRAGWARCIARSTRSSSARWQSRCCPRLTPYDPAAGARLVRECPCRGRTQSPEHLHHPRSRRGRGPRVHRDGARGRRHASRTPCPLASACRLEQVMDCGTGRRRPDSPIERGAAQGYEERRIFSSPRRAGPRCSISVWPSARCPVRIRAMATTHAGHDYRRARRHPGPYMSPRAAARTQRRRPQRACGRSASCCTSWPPARGRLPVRRCTIQLRDSFGRALAVATGARTDRICESSSSGVWTRSRRRDFKRRS